MRQEGRERGRGEQRPAPRHPQPLSRGSESGEGEPRNGGTARAGNGGEGPGLGRLGQSCSAICRTCRKRCTTCSLPFPSPQLTPECSKHPVHSRDKQQHTTPTSQGKLRHGEVATCLKPLGQGTAEVQASGAPGKPWPRTDPHPQGSWQVPDSLHAVCFLDLHLVPGLPCLEDEADGGLLPEAALPTGAAPGPHLQPEQRCHGTDAFPTAAARGDRDSLRSSGLGTSSAGALGMRAHGGKRSTDGCGRHLGLSPLVQPCTSQHPCWAAQPCSGAPIAAAPSTLHWGQRPTSSCLHQLLFPAVMCILDYTLLYPPSSQLRPRQCDREQQESHGLRQSSRPGHSTQLTHAWGALTQVWVCSLPQPGPAEAPRAAFPLRFQQPQLAV